MGKKRGDGELTPKQHAFCRAVVALGNQTEAYIAAFDHNGTRKTAKEHASRLMANGNITATIEALQKVAADKVTTKVAVNKGWVTDRLVEVVYRCLSKASIDDAEGKPTGETTFQPGVAVSALRLLGLEEGMFVEKKIIEHSKLRHLTPDQKKDALVAIEGELARRAAESAAAARKARKSGDRLKVVNG